MDRDGRVSTRRHLPRPEAVTRMSWRLAEDWNDWTAHDDTYVVDGENVVVLARYTATHKRTGRALAVRVAHALRRQRRPHRSLRAVRRHHTRPRHRNLTRTPRARSSTVEVRVAPFAPRGRPPPERGPDLRFWERTTGFEPATPNLGKVGTLQSPRDHDRARSSSTNGCRDSRPWRNSGWTGDWVASWVAEARSPLHAERLIRSVSRRLRRVTRAAPARRSSWSTNRGPSPDPRGIRARVG